jgi:peptidyl-prolyl cis-trans isomerase C
MQIFNLEQRPGFRPPPPVIVDGVSIDEAAIAREAQHHPSRTPDEAREAAARALVVRHLLLREVARLGVEPEPETDEAGRRETEEEALISTLLRQEVQVPEADRQAARRYYEANRRRFTSPPLYEARHILLSAAESDAAAYAAAEARAREALAALLAEPRTFEKMAETLSACPSGANGGNLGQVMADQVTPRFAAALAEAAPGHIHPEPIPTPYGWHVLYLERRIEGRTPPFEAVEEKIKSFLEARVWQHAVRQYVGILVGRAAITGITLDGAVSPLVQ